MAAEREHREFEAELLAPGRLSSGQGIIGMHFSLPGAAARRVAWQLELRHPRGQTVRRWRGAATTRGGAADATVVCCGVPGGVYQLRMRAETGAGKSREVIRQLWDIAIGTPAPLALAQFSPLPTARTPRRTEAAPAAGALPYTVYYGNLHSQTSHSDGGGALDHCSGAQAPQSAPFGPEDAYDYARRHGLDFLMASEHNHMYDGSDGGNPSADPEQAKGLYRSGLAAAAAYTAAHPDFLAMYGMEWGVINGGGHLNILNSPELLGWERNAGGELLADTATAKGDYGALYTLMRERGWLGQFNHPKESQFRAAGKPLGYTRDGDAAMALCEVMNSNAFSVNTDESENRRSNFEPACQRLLEAGYHVAFASNQDNHCANWGMSYTNRTALLLPENTALSSGALLDAIRARRVFATMDKQAQIVLTANGRLMGERFSTSGPLTLDVRHASATGRQVAALAIISGVPGKRGSTTQLPLAGAASGGSLTLTPEPGEHYYYARITQDDGTLLWSAPVWVSQQPAPP